MSDRGRTVEKEVSECQYAILKYCGLIEMEKLQGMYVRYTMWESVTSTHLAKNCEPRNRDYQIGYIGYNPDC